MKVEKKDLGKSQVELNIELSYEELKPYINKAVEEISQETKIEGFRPGKASYEVVKQKVGEMGILDRAARLAVNNSLEEAIQNNIKGQPVGQPQVEVTKLSPENPMAYKALVSLLPEMKLGEYKKQEIEAEKAEANEDEVKKTIETLREQYAEEKEVDRPAKKGDKLMIDIEMFQDKVPVEGGQSKDTVIILGSNHLVPGFDEKLLEASKGDELDFKLKYPEKHHQKNLAGKEVEFKVKIKKIQERNLPEVNDNFAQKFGINSIKELEEIIKQNIAQEQQQKADQKTEIKMIDKILENSSFEDIPEVLVDQEANKMLSEIEQNVSNQGGKFDDYLQSINKSQEQLKEDLKEDAEKRVKSALLIREIAKKENITASSQEIDEKQNELLEQYKGYEKVEERVKEPSYRVYLENVLINNKVLNKLKDWNIKKDSSETTSPSNSDSSSKDEDQEGSQAEDRQK